MQTARRRLRLLVQVLLLAACLVAAAASVATAQVPARSFLELGLTVKAGDTVYVTGQPGTSEQAARLIEVTPSSLVISVGGVRRELPERDVSRIRQRRPDSRRNGVLIGLLIGASGATAGAVAMASPSGSCTGGCIAVNVGYGGGIGALVGFGIDTLLQRRTDIYVSADGRSTRKGGGL